MTGSVQSRLEATSISQIRREIEEQWETFAAHETSPVLLRPEIIESWQLCRDQYQIDRAMLRSQVLMTADELEKERLEDEVLQISRPYLDELKKCCAIPATSSPISTLCVRCSSFGARTKYVSL